MERRFENIIGSTTRRIALFVTAIVGLCFVPPPAMAATSQDSMSIRIVPRDIYPPSAITDLEATPGAVGQMLLEWSAPDANTGLFGFGKGGRAVSYIVKIATFSADSVGSTTTWWNDAQNVTGEPPPSEPGEKDTLLINSLTPGVTYWAAIKGVDNSGLSSDMDTKTATPGQQAHTLVFASTPAAPSTLSGTATGTDRIQWSWSLAPGASFYQFINFDTSGLIISTTNASYLETGLSPNLAVNRVVRAGNQFGVSGPTSNVVVYTLTNAPNSLTITSVGATAISLAWSANANPLNTTYRINRSADGVVFSGVATTTSTVYTNTGLSPLTTYYYRIEALNGDGIASAPSNIVSAQTGQSFDGLAPAAPLGFKGILDATLTAFTFIWEHVVRNADGTPIDDLSHYNIYRRTSLRGTASLAGTTNAGKVAFADQVNGQTFYYSVRAVDINGNESGEALYIDSSPQQNIIFISDDGTSTVFMPTSVNDVLRSGFNPFAVPLTIKMQENSSPNPSIVLRDVDLKLLRSDTLTEVTNIGFSLPETMVSVGYEPVLSQSQLSLASQNRLSLYWFNGATWIKVGGSINQTEQTISINSSFLGRYQIRTVPLATSLTLEKANVYPRVFTPNGDGFNDRAYFVLENPNDVAVSGEILDINGRLVARLIPSSSIGSSLMWDGKDTKGRSVPSGLYYYRIKGEGKTFTGTIAIAK